MVKKAIFLKHGRLAPPRFPSGQIERHEETACPTGFSSRCITHRSSFFQTRPRLLSTRRRGAEKKGNGRRVYEKKRPVIEVFSLESSTYACYSTRTSRCVASSRRNTKKTSNVVPAIPLCRYILSSLEKCSLACVVFAEEIVSSRWRGSNFFSSLLFFTDFRSDCQFQAQWKYILHLFNPEKGNVESIFSNME